MQTAYVRIMEKTRCPNHKNRLALQRGLCTPCYQTLYSRVRNGKTTWADLETQGLCAPPAPRGRPRKQFLKFTFLSDDFPTTPCKGCGAIVRTIDGADSLCKSCAQEHAANVTP